MNVATTSKAGRAVALALLLVACAVAPARATDTRAFALCSDFSTGSLSAVDLGTRVVSQDVAPIGPDAMARWFGGRLYVVNRFGQDNVEPIDPAGWGITQYSVGNGSNPQDIAFVGPGRAYVSRYGSTSLLIVNPVTGAQLGSVSLAGFADSDGLPEMARMARFGNRLFVACQRLENFAVTQPAVIVVVDTDADTVLDVNPALPGIQGIPLTGRNPVTAFLTDRAHSRLLIGVAGNYGALDGGIEAIDPNTLTSLGIVVPETALGGDISDLEIRDGGHAYALVTLSNANQLVSWDPGSGVVLDTLTTASGGFSLPDMEANDRGELYVCRNDFASPGLLVFRMSDDALVAGPLSTGLPPLAVTFDHASDAITGAPLPTPAPATGLALSAPWPNPVRTTARFAITAPATATVRIELVDVSGRHVRTLTARPGAGAVTWDRTDEQGRRVPSGVYLARAIAGSATRAVRVVVID
jgi:hypothetical protein